MTQLPNKPSNTPLSESYDLLEDPHDEDQWLIRLKVEPWKGIVYKYGAFSLKEDKDNDKLITKFEYEILEEYLPIEFHNKVFSDEEGKAFNKLIGDIVIELLDAHLNGK